MKNVRDSVKIVKCSCNNSYQDFKYGKSMRVANVRLPKGNYKGYRCTVCGATHEI